MGSTTSPILSGVALSFHILEDYPYLFLHPLTYNDHIRHGTCAHIPRGGASALPIVETHVLILTTFDVKLSSSAR